MWGDNANNRCHTTIWDTLLGCKQRDHVKQAKCIWVSATHLTVSEELWNSLSEALLMYISPSDAHLLAVCDMLKKWCLMIMHWNIHSGSVRLNSTLSNHIWITKGLNEIWGFHSDKNLDVHLLGSNTMWTCRQIPMFWINKLLSSSELIFIYKSKWCYYKKTSADSGQS